MNGKAFTLVELLIAILLTAIISSSVYLTISSLFTHESNQLENAKTNIDTNITFLNIDKLVRSTGFGIDNNINKLISTDNDSLTFKTLLGNDTESGSWEVCQSNGVRNSTYPAVVLDDKKNKIGALDSGEVNCIPGTLIFKCKDDGNSCGNPYYYEMDIHLGGTAESSCAPGTKSLLLNDGNTKILSCVADFRFKYDSNKNVLYLGIVAQSDKKRKNTLNKTYTYNIDFSDKSIVLSHITDANKYDWKIIESIIYLENIK
ncbi:prepilin-type N-terminal cleavage/methylation domain-containing protein [Deferribacterales bacterium Es71-Z0220]|uniref:PilW family protein n=1 Tax=Deferrivibrio essentukiensis TaxID=2880922 RepID=UPI001F62573D|nr:prepilin-type N-terminal cleavage/methylation domain-containing protein [Deferrivibrio essentukiensis]MCB4204639.1 prepilin-type N-terminal cleavage/methylation domain-containing protein [Deferrivibrio essentukiensis]